MPCKNSSSLISSIIAESSDGSSRWRWCTDFMNCASVMIHISSAMVLCKVRKVRGLVKVSKQIDFWTVGDQLWRLGKTGDGFVRRWVLAGSPGISRCDAEGERAAWSLEQVIDCSR